MVFMEEKVFSLVCIVLNAFYSILYAISLAFVDRLKPLYLRAYKRAGISVNAEKQAQKPGDITVYNEKFYARVTAYRSLGIGESYMDGWWDSTDLSVYAFKILKRKSTQKLYPPFFRFLHNLRYSTFNLQTPQRSWEVGVKHYDISNKLYEKMLDKYMNYTCGYWKEATNLDDAQIAKMELIAQKLQLKPGMKVLDTGCGFGGLCKYLAEKHGVSAVGCTISKEQANWAQASCEGLPVDIRLTDYRDLAKTEMFDRIVTVGMIEHVGPRNYRSFFEFVRMHLKDDGIFLLQTVGVNHPSVIASDAFTCTYIFPGGHLPSLKQIVGAMDDLFIMEDWQNMGFHYVKTLQAWIENFRKHWPELKEEFNEPERFYRMWIFFLSMSSGCCQSRKTQLWQVVLTKDGLPEGYDAPR